MKKIISLFVALCLSVLVFACDDQKPFKVEVSGSGQPILFLPGFTVPGEIWNPTVDQLKNKYQCHVVTLAGFDSMKPIEFPWLPKVNESLENYIIDNKLEDVIVIGHSLGGTIATWLASRENSKISQLILVDALPAAGALMFPDFNPDNLSYDSPFNKQQLEMSQENFEQMATGMAMRMSTNSEAQTQIKNWILAADRKTYVYGYTDYLKLDMREDLSKINVPVTILAAALPYGEDMSRNTYETQYKNLKEYHLIISKDSAHFIMLDQPDWFKSQILKALAE
ncbi:alpha/beta hydrolase [Nonlabens mediterrranea]|uniref:Alpha/beta hydrolase n=1 Tax=Nonlabens mediterrranea TaxID=1419947 RepID=A0ABS0A2P4_9FLAO|nr:alpha/beta hydrolase [Nonlabens mediterrranea]MBF4984591.1 alpha/beta hydrolase [Nonlabens mediterrranea]